MGDTISSYVNIRELRYVELCYLVL